MKAPEKSQFDDTCGAPVSFLQFGEKFVEHESIFILSYRIPPVDGRQRETLLFAPAFLRNSGSRVIDEYSPHRLSGNGKEMSAILEVDRFRAEQAQAQLIDKCAGLQSVMLPLMI